MNDESAKLEESARVTSPSSFGLSSLECFALCLKVFEQTGLIDEKHKATAETVAKAADNIINLLVDGQLSNIQGRNMPASRKKIAHPEVELEHDEKVDMKVLVSSIHKLADGIAELNKCGLTRRAIVLLLHDATKVGKKDIEMVLEAAPLLSERYLRAECKCAPVRRLGTMLREGKFGFGHYAQDGEWLGECEGKFGQTS